MDLPRVDGIITCSGSSDLLRYTLPVAKRELDHITVITTPSDFKTHKVCQENGVDFLATDSFHRNRAPFNKGLATRLGIANIKHNDWVLCLDVDILLQSGFKGYLFERVKDKSCIYGVDRFDLRSYEQYEELIQSGHLDRLYWWNEIDVRLGNVVPLPYRVMDRCQIRGVSQPIVIGFFQLFHHSYVAENRINYPHLHPTAELSDVAFQLLWPPDKRVIIEDAIVFHLRSEDAGVGADWCSRRTKEFKPSKKRKNENLQ